MRVRRSTLPKKRSGRLSHRVIHTIDRSGPSGVGASAQARQHSLSDEDEQRFTLQLYEGELHDEDDELHDEDDELQDDELHEELEQLLQLPKPPEAAGSSLGGAVGSTGSVLSASTCWPIPPCSSPGRA